MICSMAPIKSPPKNNTLISNFFKKFQRTVPGTDTANAAQHVVDNNRAPSPPRLPATVSVQSHSPSSTPNQSKQSVTPEHSQIDGSTTPTSGAQTNTLLVTSLTSPSPQNGRIIAQGAIDAREEMRSSTANDSKATSEPIPVDVQEADVLEATSSPPDTIAHEAPMPCPPPPLPTSTPTAKPPNASFSSSSTLTSVPKSSQASALPISSSTSSRRIVSDGLQGIAGSDSDSEDLEDFSTLYAKKRRKLSHDDDNITVAQAPPQKAPPAPKSTRLAEQAKRKNFFKAFPRSPQKANPRNSLASLVADTESGQNADAIIASIESAVDESRKREDQQKVLLADHKFAGAALIDAAGSDTDERERMTMALARTEALHESNDYHFFLDSEPLHLDFNFPVESLPDVPWARIYQNEQSRRHACTSGFAAELAAKYPLPMSVTSWMACQLQYEPSEELREAYVEILRASAQHGQSISDTWGSLNSVYKTKSLFEQNWSEHVKDALPPGLPYMIRLASFRAPAIDSIVSEAQPHSTCAAFLDMALMNVDELVKEDLGITTTIANSVEDMLDALSEDSFSQLIPLAVATMFSPSNLPEHARCRAIAALPASIPRSHRLRRRLALEYFSTADQKAVDEQDWPTSIVHTIKTKPAFQMSESTDYALLMLLVTMLDIAVDAGWIDHSLFASREPRGPWGERAPPTEAEDRHNAQIDAIVDALKSVSSRIRDAGTSHLRRTETKSLMEQVLARLQYGVRSRIKPVQGVFDGMKDGILRQATFKAKAFSGKKVEIRDQVMVIPVEELSDRDVDADDEGAQRQGG